MWGLGRMGRAHDGVMKIRLAKIAIFVAVKVTFLLLAPILTKNHMTGL